MAKIDIIGIGVAVKQARQDRMMGPDVALDIQLAIAEQLKRIADLLENWRANAS